MSRPVFNLVTVNTAPERAKRVVGKCAQELADRYELRHVGNAEAIDQVAGLVTAQRPNLIFTASMWSAEEVGHILGVARGIVPDIRTFVIPQGLQVKEGPEGVVRYILDTLPGVLDA